VKLNTAEGIELLSLSGRVRKLTAEQMQNVSSKCV